MFKLDEKLEPSPWLAEGYELVDEKTWKITLKEGVKFSNGKDLTADKVIASLKRTGEMNDRAKSLKTAEFVSEGNTITIRTPEPYVTLVNDLCDPYAVIVDVEGTTDFENAPVCTGPFKMESFEPSKKAVVVKNENYWDGIVKLDKIVYTIVADFNTLALSLQNGEIDVAQDLSPEAAASIESQENLVIKQTAQPRTYKLYFNLNKLTEKAVREAVMFALDKETMSKSLKGAFTAANGAFLDETDYTAKNLTVKTGDLEKAKAVLAEAGYVDKDGDGYVDKNGKTLTVQLNLYQRLAMESIAVEIQAQLKKAGINVDVITSEKATFFEPGDFEIGMYSIVTTPTGDPYSFLRDSLQSDGAANYGKYKSTVVEGYLKELTKTFKHEDRVELINKIQQQVIDDAAMDYIGFNNMRTGMSKGIEGYLTTPNDYYQITKDTDKK